MTAGLVLIAGAVGLLGLGASLLITQRARRSMRGVASPGLESGLLRLQASVAGSLEKTVIGTLRALQLPQGAVDLGYGDLYFEADSDDRVLIRSRSMLDRGLLAVLVFRSTGRTTAVAYSIVRLPSDEGVHAAALRFEVALVQAVRMLDPMAEVLLSSSALRGVERTTAVAARPRA